LPDRKKIESRPIFPFMAITGLMRRYHFQLASASCCHSLFVVVLIFNLPHKRQPQRAPLVLSKVNYLTGLVLIKAGLEYSQDQNTSNSFLRCSQYSRQFTVYFFLQPE